jgi:isopenicillin N synthase-like dioxygenase
MSLSSPAIPVLDLAMPDAEIAVALDRACREIGFYVVVNHGVQPGLIAALHAQSRAFFDLPLAEKLRVARPRPEQNRGFIAEGAETLARLAGETTPPDRKEVFTIGPIDAGDAPYFTRAEAYPHFAPNLWPDRPAELEPTMRAYWRAATGLATRLLSISARALHLDPGHFETLVDRQISMLRLIDYPPGDSTSAPGQLRAGAHTDLNMLTLVHCTTDVGGIEVKARDGGWVRVPHDPGAFIVNIGDVLMRWTNDLWVSTPHRVVNPPPGDRSRRQTIAFFFQANYDAELACLPSCVRADRPARYAPTTIGAYRAERFARTAEKPA